MRRDRTRWKLTRIFRRWVWPIVTGFAFGGTIVFAGVIDEPHLSYTPRSLKEMAHVREQTTVKPQPATSEDSPGGEATVTMRQGTAVFAQPSANLNFQQFLDFRQGNILFHRQWVPAPGPDPSADGLGPVFNALSCQMCHIRDGRGHPPGPDETPVSLVLKLALSDGKFAVTHGIEEYHSTRPDPVYGHQLQSAGHTDHRAEYTSKLTYEKVEIRLNDGTVTYLRRPVFAIENPGYGPLHPDTQISPRIAPQMIGLGLLESIPALDILTNADPEDSDGDGISGRANIVWSDEHATPMLGRFGHKASAPTIRQQSARALANDMGLSSSLYPAPWGDCTAAQAKCRMALHGDNGGDTFEVDDATLDLLVFYSRNLAVPARHRTQDPIVLRGRNLFHELGCSSCHLPAFVTHILPQQPEQSNQLIWPYSDLLLHDMGEGLADELPEARASGQEWRTAPLWGLGRVQQVNPRAGFLHDGRARTILEAVIWHGGEAQAARDAMVALPKAERDALVRFLESL